MEVEENQTYQECKLPRIGNGDRKGDEQYPDDEEDGEVKRRSNGGGGGGGFDFSRLCGWPSSRIVRVSRASGGKDRHSKVLTSKGLRDRRVRLSVNTAIQFYDLQDRLGCDQPSKAVEWLLKAAASSIAELPSINTSFEDTIKQQQEQQQQLSDEKRSTGGTEHGFDSADVEIDGSFDPNYQIQQQQQQQNGALMSKSACSSNSENSKEARPDGEPLRADRPDSGLSLLRSKSRIKARERARGRAAEKEKDKENETTPCVLHHHQHDQLGQNLNPLSQNASSFTELLTSGMKTTSNAGGNNNNNNNNTGINGSVHQNHSNGGGGNASEANFFHKSPRHWSATPMDYFATAGVLGPSSTRNATHGFSGQLHYGEHYQEMQPFSFVPDHFVPLVTVAGGNNGSNNNNNNNDNNNNNNNVYDLNFTISSSSSSGLGGFNRGTLQSNSSTPSLLPHLQRFPSTDGSPSAFFIGTTPPAENHHHFLTGFDARLQLCYGDDRHSDYKGKGKS